MTVERGDRVVPAGERERTLAEQTIEDPDRLLQTIDPGPGRIEREAGGLVLAAQPASPEPELEAAAGQVVQGGGLLGEHHRMAIVDREHHGPEPEAGGDARRIREGDERRRLVPEEVRHEVIANQERREAQILDSPEVLLPRRWALRLVVDDPEAKRP